MELSPKSTEIINKWREGGDKRRESARNARELYENLSDSLKDKVDALSDSVTNKVLADAEAKYGDTIYFGQQFNKDLMKACRDYATGYSRDSEHFTTAFRSEPRWLDTVDEAFTYIEDLIKAFPELKGLANEASSTMIEVPEEVGAITVQNNKPIPEEGMAAEVSNFNDAEIQDTATPTDVNPDLEKSHEGIALERTLEKSPLEKKLEWLKSLQFDREGDVLNTANEYIEKYPDSDRVQAVSDIFDNSQIRYGLEYDRSRVLHAAAMIDNFSNTAITSESELKRLIEHHQYKYQDKMDKVGISLPGLISLFIDFGKFSPNFSKEDAEQFIEREYKN